jgi:NAD(P)-dependent dehydrogenase (short-subunit alcohol dehydrogenase family)
MTHDSKQRLDGKVALITGASRGIGLAVAEAFLARGASVLLTARHAEGLEAARAALGAFPAERVATSAAHSAKEEDVRRAFQAAADTFGRVDVAVNNAATNPSMAPLADIDLEVFDKIVATNLRGYLIVAREAVRRFRAQGGGGVVVNVSTVGAYRAFPGLGAYGVSKAAVNMLTQTLASELAPEGIRVSGVAPGVVRTRFSEALWKDPETEKRMARAVPLGRLAEPEDIAGAVAFLASDEAAYLTGHTIVVDGGMTAR